MYEINGNNSIRIEEITFSDCWIKVFLKRTILLRLMHISESFWLLQILMNRPFPQLLGSIATK